ncbi:Histidine phosphatase superfamily (branch 1) [Nakaseomyces glabratus]|nr:Histidine phosphatase superfamily (branch 1) [Nakaseomyces glabratus]
MILHRLLLLLNLDWNREVEMTVQDLDFRALPGYFKGYSARDTPETRHNATELDFLAFDDQFTTWKQLYQAIPKDTDTHSYKLLVLARHGEGYHNAAEARYGEKAWNEYWSKLEGDQYGSWLDAELTPLGKKQALEAGQTYLTNLTDGLQLLPHKFFVSPMRRCLDTYIREWEPVFSTHRPSNATVNVKVIEYLRETLGVHTCDERVSHSQALSEYQDHRYNNSDVTVHFDYPGNYSEKDQLWYPDHRETKAEMDRRTRIGLREMFSSVNTTDKVISLTCHSGVIASVLRNIKHPAIDHLQTGKVVYAVVELSKAPTDDQPMLVVS